jgi:hypothetical protein
MRAQITEWLTGGAAWWVIAAFLRAMPAPGPNASVWYLWAHNFAQLIGANFDRLTSKAKEPTQ